MSTTITRPSGITKVKVDATCTVKDGASGPIRAQISGAIPAVEVTNKNAFQTQIAASGNATFTPENLLGSAGNFKSCTIAIQNGSASTGMTIEINDCGTAITADSYFSLGDADGISQIAIVNTDGSNALDILIAVGR